MRHPYKLSRLLHRPVSHRSTSPGSIGTTGCRCSTARQGPKACRQRAGISTARACRFPSTAQRTPWPAWCSVTRGPRAAWCWPWRPVPLTWRCTSGGSASAIWRTRQRARADRVLTHRQPFSSGPIRIASIRLRQVLQALTGSVTIISRSPMLGSLWFLGVSAWRWRTPYACLKLRPVMADHPLGSLTGYTLHESSQHQARLVSIIGIGTECR